MTKPVEKLDNDKVRTEAKVASLLSVEEKVAELIKDKQGINLDVPTYFTR